MSRVDPECFPNAWDNGSRVCAACIGDDDLKCFIREHVVARVCDFCDGRSASTNLGELAQFIEERLNTFYGRAVDQLPYETREGGYQGWNVSTYELLYDVVELDLPNDLDGSLFHAIAGEIVDDQWCEFNWLRLDLDQSYQFDWDRFCETIKYHRRFFFHELGGGDRLDPDDRSLYRFLFDFCKLIDELDLIRDWPAGQKLYRARGRRPGIRYKRCDELGPPPRQLATQTNRMNPPGIPMFYGADKRKLSIAETGEALVSVGRFETLKPIKLLDLAELRKVPGIFSQATRKDILGLRFLHEFGNLISAPIQGDDRTHVDYIPTQVFTEFLKDYRFENGPIDGIRYCSATGDPGANVVLFATQDNICEKHHDKGPAARFDAWLQLTQVWHIET